MSAAESFFSSSESDASAITFAGYGRLLGGVVAIERRKLSAAPKI
jgi:hypothetical protein